MKNLGYYLFVLITALTFSSCNKTPKVTGTALIGNIGDLSDTLYFYGTERFYDQLDTIILDKGKFTHQIEIDTTIIAYLFSKDIEDTRVFIGKGEQLQVSRSLTDTTKLVISGNQMHADYDSLLVQMANTTDTVATVKEYITKHPLSITSIAAIQDYLVWQENPSYSEIEAIINDLAGTLRDRQFIEQISSKLPIAQRAQVGKSSLFFHLANLKGKFVDKKEFNDKLLLLYFWTTWDENSKQLNKELKPIHKKLKSQKDFQIVGISLDADTTNLAQVVKQDTINWTILKDPKGWDSQVAERYGITQLPTTFLINKKGVIIARDLPIDSLKTIIQEHIKKK